MFLILMIKKMDSAILFVITMQTSERKERKETGASRNEAGMK
jgi:hypothetical protein